ncbi:MAG TPA: PQQ-binding-like beta-propeller repeat protein, partial [bacterium]|nr:PQQ-binding-like beta-propeller repeat protein [bacterium]
SDWIKVRITAAPGSRVGLQVTASDPEHDFLKYEWSADAGTFSSSDATPNWTSPLLRGNYKITVKVSDPYGNNASMETYVAVLDGPVTSIYVTPSSTTINAGQTAVFDALCLDDAALRKISSPVRCKVTWSVGGNIGVVNDAGKFAAFAPGIGEVTAAFGSVSGSASVTVIDANSPILNTAASLSGACDTQWDKYRCNVYGSNEAVKTLFTTLTYRKSKNVGGSIYGQALAKGGRFFIGDYAGKIHCIDQATMDYCAGWTSLDVGAANGIASALAFSNDTNYIFAASGNGKIYKIDISGGTGFTLAWSLTLAPIGQIEFNSAPVVDNNYIYITSQLDGGTNNLGRIYAIKDNTTFGALDWTYPPQTTNPSNINGFGYAQPVFANIGGTDLIFAGNANTFYSVNKSTGLLNDSFSCGGQCYYSPIIADYGGTLFVYVTTSSGKLIKYNPLTKAQVWTATLGTSSLGPPAYSNHIFYIGTIDGSGNYYAVEDLGNGAASYNIKWSKQIASKPGRFQAAPTIFPSGVFFTTYNYGSMGMFDPTTGELIWRIDTPGIQASADIMNYIGDGEAYIGDTTGSFHAMQRNFPPVIDS